MRNLVRNQRGLYYAVKTGTLPILDEWGNDTLEVRVTYGAPLLLRANVSANVGEESVNVFGAQTQYSRVVCLADSVSPMSEGDKVWIGVEPTGANNYIVAKVADSKNGVLIALREVSNRE